MLQNINIQNFRCFEDFKAKGFERINLIGGKNNSGKTCLLEGIQFFNNNESARDLVLSRQSNASTNQDAEGMANLCFNRRVKNDIIIEVNDKIQFKYNYQQLTSGFTVSSKYIDLEEKSNFKEQIVISKLILDKHNQVPKTDDLAVAYSKADRRGKSDLILMTLRLIDSKIEDIRTYPDIPLLYLKYASNKLPIPINYFGDSIQKLVKYILAYADFEPTGKFNTLLIDEVENGLHYTAHYEFWKHIFKLSKELNVQVFATTHSMEMIKAFNKVAIEEGEAAYFEMMRNEHGQIEALKHSPEILEEELDGYNIKIRGEQYKKSIELATDLLHILNDAGEDAREKLHAQNISVPYIEDGWLWQLMPNGEKVKLEKVEPLK